MKAFVFGGVCLEGLKISGAVKCVFVLFWVLLGFEEGKTCFSSWWWQTEFGENTVESWDLVFKQGKFE